MCVPGPPLYLRVDTNTQAPVPGTHIHPKATSELVLVFKAPVSSFSSLMISFLCCKLVSTFKTFFFFGGCCSSHPSFLGVCRGRFWLIFILHLAGIRQMAEQPCFYLYSLAGSFVFWARPGNSLSSASCPGASCIFLKTFNLTFP